MKVVIVIPSRWKSSRFPGKPLALIDKVPMIKRVYKKACMAKKADKVFVATDNSKIFNFCKNNDIEVIMTSNKCKTGTDRVCEVSKRIHSDIYVNLQGDEPLINPNCIDAVINLLKRNLRKKIIASTAYVEVDNSINKENTGVYLTCNKFHEVIFLSRYKIPFNFKKKTMKKKHVGLYAYTKNALKVFNKLRQGNLEKTESIEILRLLENGYKVIAKKIYTPLLDVNYSSDVKKIERFLKNK